METPRGFEIESNMPKRQAAPRAELLIQQGLTDNLNKPQVSLYYAWRTAAAAL